VCCCKLPPAYRSSWTILPPPPPFYAAGDQRAYSLREHALLIPCCHPFTAPLITSYRWSSGYKSKNRQLSLGPRKSKNRVQSLLVVTTLGSGQGRLVCLLKSRAVAGEGAWFVRPILGFIAAAPWAAPVLRDILKGCTCRDAVFFVPAFRIIKMIAV